MNNKKDKFGAIQEYKKGDIVVWRGNNPCIGRVKARCVEFRDSWNVSKTHNSLSYTNLRYATPKEIEKLGRKQMLLITKKS